MPDIDQLLNNAHAALRAGRFPDAETYALDVLLSDPANPAALCITASTYDRRGDALGAYRLFWRAIASDSSFEPAYAALSRRYYQSGRKQEGARLYSEWARVAPDDPEAVHMVAAFGGTDAPPRCSELYVQKHFDNFAESFDEVLVENLGYRGPQVIAELFATHSVARQESAEVLDAGCGTGLCGPLIRAHCSRLVGVDLSKNMLDRARRRGCYDELIVAELSAFLDARKDSFNTIVSSDVLTYIGDLARTTRSVCNALKPDGLFIATTESLPDVVHRDYELTLSGRYAHSESYLRSAVESAGLVLILIRQDTLRVEMGKGVFFFSFVAMKARA